MTLAQLKDQVLQHMTKEEVRQFGNLSYKATWEAALDKCSEAVALAADAAQEAQQPAETTAESITNVVYSQQSRDAFYWVAYAVVLAVFTIFLLSAKLTQLAWQASAPLRHRASDRIHSEWWALVGSWPDLIAGL